MDDLRNLLTLKKLTIATTESCTGGLFANYLTRKPGASVYFKGSIVAYHKDVKVKILNISENIPLVSKTCAEQMATGLSRVIPTDISVSTTGKLEPGGLVYACIYYLGRYHTRIYNITDYNRVENSNIIINDLAQYIVELIGKG